MYKYLIVLHQVGDGCDHTIGCGTRVEVFTAPSRAAAIVHSEDLVRELTSPDQTIADATVYAIDDSITTALDVATIRARALAMRAAERGEDDERREYERLRRKYETPRPAATTDLSALKERLRRGSR
jgi:hypothetical protein